MPVCRFEGRAVRTTALFIWRCTLGSGGVACGNYFWRERVREGRERGRCIARVDVLVVNRWYKDYRSTSVLHIIIATHIL